MNTILEHIDDVTSKCGFFTTETTVNNSYGCTHPKQSELDKDDITKKLHGKCYCFSCPLGYEANEQDFIEHGENPDSMTEGEWLVMPSDWLNSL